MLIANPAQEEISIWTTTTAPHYCE